MTTSQPAIYNRGTPDGVFIIDKPAEWTSHDVVAKVRKILNTRRVGHTGTLDPFATGVLVICVNRATRLVQYMAADEKEYLARMRLGVATETGDLTGRPLSPLSDARHITAEMVEESLAHYRGPIKQVPPMYSAKKVGGVKLYEIARRGQEIEREPVEVEIKLLELYNSPDIHNIPVIHTIPSSKEAEVMTRDFLFRVICSSGTYIRTLAEEIGQRLGVGAHLVQLRRVRAGDCDLGRAVTLERLAELAQSGSARQVMISMAEAITLEALQLDEPESIDIRHGRFVKSRAGHGKWSNGTRAKLCDRNGNLIAIGQYDADRQIWRPLAVLSAE